jgi:DNA-binding transcriptional ArsR family regulator
MEKRLKRTFNTIREKILLSLAEEKRTINDVSKAAQISWRTAESHLNYLSGRKLVNEAYSSEYARIFEITPEGEEAAKRVTGNHESKNFHDDTKRKIISGGSRIRHTAEFRVKKRDG